MADAKITRALLSLTDKSGLAELAKALQRHNIVMLSTGGTAKALRDLGHTVVDVAEVTGFPEILDGRVKTLHPKIHGGLLAIRGNEEHNQAATIHGIAPIDLLIVNLYAFEDALARGATYADTVENIDVGGPAMIRAAAKNHASVTVVVEVEDYPELIAELDRHAGSTSPAFRQRLAAKAFARTASYDAAIANWLAKETGDTLPKFFALGGTRHQALRYGENPHQQAASYHTTGSANGLLSAIQVQGKELSYNNINDGDAAIEAVASFAADEKPACVIVKHANPCGVALGPTLVESYQKALASDPVSAFGGIVAFNRPLDAETATALSQIFTEVILAPGASPEAKEILAAKKNLRLLLLHALPDPDRKELVVKSVTGGLLVQTRDAQTLDEKTLRCVSKRQPNPSEWRDLRFAWKVAQHVKSNAIVFAKNEATVGIGAGQMSRIDSTRIAVTKSLDAAKALGLTEPLVKGAVLASDAFFPFPDGIEAAAAAGATAIIQPGGALKDPDVIAAADRAGLAMLFTGLRHFRH